MGHDFADLEAIVQSGYPSCSINKLDASPEIPAGAENVQDSRALLFDLQPLSETMAQAVAEGARSTRAFRQIKRVPETVAQDRARGPAHFKLDQAAPEATDSGTG